MQRADWADQILSLTKAREISLRELAADMGVSHVYLGSVVRGEKPPSAKLKIKLWAQTNCDLSREQMLELLLPDDIAEEFHAFEVARGKTEPSQADSPGVNE